MKYPRRRSQGIIEMAVTDSMPRKKSGEDLKWDNRDLREENEYLKDKVAYLEALYIILMKEKAASLRMQRKPRKSNQLKAEERNISAMQRKLSLLPNQRR